MAERCAACDAEFGDDAERCPSCGLVFGRETPATAIAGPVEPAHVGLYLGDVPTVVAETPAEPAQIEREVPATPRTRPALDPRSVLRRAGVLALGVAAVLAVLVVFVASRRPDDAYTRREEAFERFEDAAGLDPREPPEPLDVDAFVARTGDAETRRAAVAAHRPFPDEARASIHAFFEAYLDRVLEISPDHAFHLGVHPHPREPGAFDDGSLIRWMLLARDAARVLREWPGADGLPAHDRTDRAALLDNVEMSLRWRETRDLDRLDAIDGWFHPFQRLAGIACCPAPDRIAAATSRLRASPAHLLRLVDGLDEPPRARVLVTADGLEAADEYLETYARAWPDAPATAVADLQAAIDLARRALSDCGNRLRTKVAQRATGAAAIGPENTATTLRVGHRLPFDARDLYVRSLDELRAAHDELRAARKLGWTAIAARHRAADESQISGLRDACPKWIRPPPEDAGVVVARLPRLWREQGAAATYLDPGAFLGPGPGVVHLGGPLPEDHTESGDVAALDRRHTLAHETYPGHRLQAVASRAACRLRRFIGDGVLVEGWAVYAEGLLHETGGCAEGRYDVWARAWSRMGHAVDTLTALLVVTGSASETEVVALLRAIDWDEPTVAGFGRIAAMGLYPLGYFPGRDEIVALRRAEEERLGAAFDLRAFHARLLAAGPIPPRLIAEEWRAEDR